GAPARGRGERDAAPPRIGLPEPAADALEDAARRVGEMLQHLLRRRARLRLREIEPGLELLARALGLALRLGPLEDHVARFDRGLGHRVREQAPQAADLLERLGQRAVVTDGLAPPRQRMDALDAREREAIAKLRRLLRG